MLFKSLCSKVSVGSRKVRIFHPSLSTHIDPLVIRRGLLGDSAPRACVSIGTYIHQGVLKLWLGMGVPANPLPWLPHPQPESNPRRAPSLLPCFQLNCPHSSEGASQGTAPAVHGNEMPENSATAPPMLITLTPGITISFQGSGEMERCS